MTKAALTSLYSKMGAGGDLLTAYWLAPVTHNLALLNCSLPPNPNSYAQKTIALLLTEAEYMALSDCSCQVVWIHSLMCKLGYHFGPIPICGDNQGSIFILSNSVTEKRTKHIDICYHYIREVIEKKYIELFFIDRNDNPADLFTKNLGSVKFLKF